MAGPTSSLDIPLHAHIGILVSMLFIGRLLYRGYEFYVLGAFFCFFEFFIECRRRHFRAFKHIDTLRADSGQQIVQVFGAVHIVRDQVIDLIVGEVAFFFTCVDQFFYIVVLVV